MQKNADPLEQYLGNLSTVCSFGPKLFAPVKANAQKLFKSAKEATLQIQRFIQKPILRT